MPDSAENMSAARADNTTIESLETEGYLLANKRSDATVKRSVRLSTVRDDDASKIGETKTNMPKDIDSTIGIPKPAISIIARDSLSEERAANDFIGDVIDAEEASHFVTGSSYKGGWDILGMSGVGRYVMPHGTAYEGEIRDGMFHGHGSLYWPKNGRLDVVHHRGKLREYRYTFEDGLVYDYEDWSYCKFPDRRFYESVKNGLRPGGRTLKTGKQPTKVLPFGCYDAGDGVLDPKTWRITSYDDSKKVLRVPKKEEYDWIIKNCRKSWTEPTGYRLSLNENWSDNPPDLPYNIVMSDDSPDSWWKRLTTFKRQFDTTGEESSKDISIGTQDKDLPTPEVCLCGQYVLLGEPCWCGGVPSVADDTAEVREVSLQSVVHSSNYSSEKSASQEKCKRIATIKQCDSQVNESSTRATEDLEVGIDRLSNISKGPSKYYFSDESLGVEKELENRREDATEALEIIVERTKSTDAVEKETLQKSSVDRHIVQHGSRVDATETPMPMKISMGNDKDEKAKQKHVTEPEDRRKVVDESDEEIHAKRRYTVDVGNRREQKEYTSILAEERSQRREEKESIIAANEKREGNTDERSLLENYDYATVSIPREKVPRVTEPETNNGRRMMSERSKLLPKGTTTERDLPFDRSGEVAIRSDVIDTPVIRETLQESTVSHLVSNETPNNIAANVTTSATKTKKKFVNDADDDKLPLDQSEESIEDTQSTRDFYRSSDVPKEKSRDFDQKKPMEYPETSKISVGVSDNTITNEGKPSEIRQDDFSPRNFDEEMREIETISGSSNRIASRIIAKEDSRLWDVEEQTSTEGNSVSLKNDLPILEELHRSLATISPEKQKSTEGKEIIEIYNKYSSKKKAVAKPMNVNVWRLSGSVENNGSQSNTKDILFPPTLTTQRGELIECTRRKPCGFDACKPALPEVRTGGSLCRKEFPFNIPAKSSRSSAGNICKKKK